MRDFYKFIFSFDLGGFSILGVRFDIALFQTANANYTDNSVVDADPDLYEIERRTTLKGLWEPSTPETDPTTGSTIYTGGGELRGAYDAYLKSINDQNRFSWVNHLLVPGLQAAANISILQYQKSQYDDIESRRIGYLDSAVSQWCSCVQEVLDKIEDATDDVPKPAMYQPVSPSGEQYQTISDNLEILPTAKAYACYVNETHREQDLIRQTALNSDFFKVNEITWVSIGELIRGDLPQALVVETLTKSKEASLKNGRFGRSSRQTARDLGLTSYRVQKAARAEAREERASANRDISPVSRNSDIREMMVTPQQRVGFAIQQGQLLQNSLQNANNACAKKAPYLQAQVQVMLQKCQQEMTLLAGKAGLVNSNVPDFASVLNSQIRDVISGIGKGLDNGFGDPSTSNIRVAPPVYNTSSPSIYSGGSSSGKAVVPSI